MSRSQTQEEAASVSFASRWLARPVVWLGGAVSAVLIVVVLLMLIISLVSHQLGMETGLSVALFPMVIIAMTIERMSVVWEERGAADAIRGGGGSLLVEEVEQRLPSGGAGGAAAVEPLREPAQRLLR